MSKEIITTDFRSPNGSDAGTMTIADLGKAPAFHRTEESPETLVRKRYMLNERLSPFTRVIYGVDKQSRNPPNQRITLFAYDDVDLYLAHVKSFKQLRSKFVANYLDSWEVEEIERCFIVIERGGLALDEYLHVERKTMDTKAKFNLLQHLVAIWMFLYAQGYGMRVTVTAFMRYQKHWKLYDPTCLISGRTHPTNRTYVAPDEAQRIADGSKSILKATEEDWDEDPFTLGSLLFEFLLLHPLFIGKTLEDILGVVQADDLIVRLREESELDETELGLVWVMQQLLTIEKSTVDMTHEILIRVSDAIADDTRRDHTAAQSPKRAGYLPSVV